MVPTNVISSLQFLHVITFLYNLHQMYLEINFYGWMGGSVKYLGGLIFLCDILPQTSLKGVLNSSTIDCHLGSFLQIAFFCAYNLII